MPSAVRAALPLKFSDPSAGHERHSCGWGPTCCSTVVAMLSGPIEAPMSRRIDAAEPEGSGGAPPPLLAGPR